MKRSSAVGARSHVALAGAFLAVTFASGCARPVSSPKSDKPAVILDGDDSEAPSCPKLRAQGDSPLIDDFEAKGSQILDHEGRDGFWFNYDDGTSGKLERRAVEVADGDGPKRVLHVVSSGFTKWGAGFGFNLHGATTGGMGCVYDASVYSGVRIRARGHGRLRMTLGDLASTPPLYGGSCTRPGDSCYDHGGIWLQLADHWKTFEVPFCAFMTEGWSGTVEGVDPQTLLGFHFRIGERQDAEFWLDDLTFYRAATNDPAPHCGLPCPLEAAPTPALIEPARSSTPLTENLTLHTFEQPTKTCGSITRRYLTYVPRRLTSRTSAPVLIALHGSGTNAETMRTYLARDRFDALAERDGVVIVYGNAAPGVHSGSDAQLLNSGAWRQGYFDDGQVDDIDYLERVIEDMKSRSVIDGSNALYLTGISNGGGMVLEAARRLAARINGVAALMPYDGKQPKPVPDLACTKLKRVLIGYSLDDPGLMPGYHDTLAPLPAQWATAMGIPQEVVATPTKTPMPDVVKEGADYQGKAPVPLATRDSHVTQLDMVAPTGSAKVRVLILDRAGHLWPNPSQLTEDWVLNRWGFHNQDFDAADLVWDFMGVGASNLSGKGERPCKRK